jgi:hypothetical protein
LHQKDVLATNVLIDFDERFAVRKGAHRAFTQIDADGFADRFRQRLIGCPAKNLHNDTKNEKTTERWFQINWSETVTIERRAAREKPTSLR